MKNMWKTGVEMQKVEKMNNAWSRGPVKEGEKLRRWEGETRSAEDR